MILLKSSKPHIAILGKLPTSTSYRNIDRYEMAEQPENTLVLRFDDQLYFANAAYFQEVIKSLVLKQNNTIKLFVLDAGSIHNMDSTGMQAIEQVYDFLQSQNIRFSISGMVGPVRDKIKKAGVLAKLGQKSQFLTTHQAITHFKSSDNGMEKGWTKDALQSNFEEE